VWRGQFVAAAVAHNVEHSLVLSFLYNDADDFDLGWMRCTGVHDDHAGTHELFGSVKDQHWFHDTLVEFGFAGQQSYDNSQPQGSAPYVLLVDGATGNYFQAAEQEGGGTRDLWMRRGLRCTGTGRTRFREGESFERADDSIERAGEIQALYSDNTTLSRVTTFTGRRTFACQHAAGVRAGYVDDQFALHCDGGVRMDWTGWCNRRWRNWRASLNWMPFAKKTRSFRWWGFTIFR